MAITQVLLVEDNLIDVRLLRAAFSRVPEWETALQVIADGEEAIRQLLTGESKPDLIILDLNLPKKDGADVLRVIRQDLTCKRVPVIIFSSAPEDAVKLKMNSVNVEADAYVRKPTEVAPYMLLAKHFRRCYEAALRFAAHTPAPARPGVASCP